MQFETLGADPASVDAARVLRLVGTKKQKDSPEITNRNVHLVDREYFSQNRITLRGLIEGLENSQPENVEDFNACKSEWRQMLKKLEKAEAEIIRPEAEQATRLDTEDFRVADGEYWRLNTLHHHRPRATWLSAEVSGTAKWLETYQLHGMLRELYGTPELLLSLCELTGRERKESRDYIEWIPCNYVMLTHCPGETARLVYSELEKRYTFNGLANAVLNWSQKECKKYHEEKEARKAILKIALIENIEQLKRAVNATAVEATPKYGDFRVIAQMRFVDIVHWLELQKDSNGDVPQKVRDLSVFWALVSARRPD